MEADGDTKDFPDTCGVLLVVFGNCCFGGEPPVNNSLTDHNRGGKCSHDWTGCERSIFFFSMLISNKQR